ncbi:MAG: outer membrane protein [Stappiaceae bacterium]
MSIFRKVAGAVAGLLLVSSQSFAADLPEPFVVEPVPAAGGWYLRGDIGYKFYQAPTGSTFAAGTGTFIDNELDDTFLIGAGIGYKWNDFFRTDLTVDYEAPAGYSGRANCVGCVAPGQYSTETADIDVWSFMLNGYVDLLTWNKITPYVGAGLGVSIVSTSDVQFVNPDGSRGSYDGDSQANFAWALMAGAAYEVNQNWSIDAGYRYFNIGDAKTEVVPAGNGNSRINYEDIQAHELRVGVRYNFF